MMQSMELLEQYKDYLIQVKNDSDNADLCIVVVCVWNFDDNFVEKF